MRTETISRNIKWTSASAVENKVAWAKFTIHFETALSSFVSKFYCREHTNWWTAVAYESKVSINIELTYVQSHRGRETVRERETEREGRGRKHIVPCIRLDDVLFLFEKANRAALFTRPSKRFRLRALHVPVLCRSLHASSNAAWDCHVLSWVSARAIYFDL